MYCGLFIVVICCVGSRVLSIQPTNQLFLLLKRVSHGDRSDNLRRCFVPPVLQAHQLPALIETVTGHDEMEVSLLRSFPSAYSSLMLDFRYTPDFPSDPSPDNPLVEVGPIPASVWLP